MRVVHVITGLSTGGAERALYSVLAGGLVADGEHTVLSLRDEGSYGTRIRELGVPVRTLGIHRAVPGGGAVFRLVRLVREFNPNLIQGWMYHGNLAASLAKWRMPGRPALAWNIRQCLYTFDAERPITRQVIRANRLLSARPDAILYNSQLSRQQHEEFGFDGSRGGVIPNGFDLEQWRPDGDQRKKVRETLGIPESAPVIGHIARFHPMKDHTLFLRAAVAIAKAHPSVHFVLVGRDVQADNPIFAGIVPGWLENRFLWLGERHDMSGLMQAMDVFCQSSWSEAFPNVVGEAMAAGVPCVVTDVGDSAALVGDTGLVVPSKNENALTQGLLAMVARSDDARRALGKAARARIQTNFSLQHMVRQYSTLYERLVSNRAA
ncbi:MAG: glycosyltransferase [Gammaproteobacteria bacterium]